MRAYLNVEGLPDRVFYYLIGFSVEGGECVRHRTFWADREADEPGIWNAYLEATRDRGDDFVFYHYGGYETQLLERMSIRHGGEPELLARMKGMAVNVLSAVHTGIYFPTHANDLKRVAGSLGMGQAVAGGLVQSHLQTFEKPRQPQLLQGRTQRLGHGSTSLWNAS